MNGRHGTFFFSLSLWAFLTTWISTHWAQKVEKVRQGWKWSAARASCDKLQVTSELYFLRDDRAACNSQEALSTSFASVFPVVFVEF